MGGDESNVNPVDVDVDVDVDVKSKPSHCVSETRKNQIFFCSRTHSQLQQVVGEFRRCSESYIDNASMAILGSRSLLCVNDDVLRQGNNEGRAALDEKCRDLGKTRSCHFSHRTRDLLESLMTSGVWDIEDAVKMGRRQKGCPYYASRAAVQKASIVFAPYNYILDCNIRASMGVELRDSIVLFDEAHNIEDVSRTAASTQLNRSMLHSTIDQLRGLSRAGTIAFKSLLQLVSDIVEWMDAAIGILYNSDNLHANEDMESKSNVWSGREALEIFAQRFSLSEASLDVYLEHFKTVMSEQEDVDQILGAYGDDADDEGGGDQHVKKKQILQRVDISYDTDTEAEAENNYNSSEEGDVNDSSDRKLPSSACFVLKGLLTTLKFMMKDNHRYADDYRIVILPERSNESQLQSQSKKGKQASHKREGDYVLNIWCLSAAVAFADLKEQCHSVVLSSGTLSPLDSFAGELQTSFPVRVEAGHVIEVKKQVFVAAVSTCNTVSLNCSYSNQKNEDFQDAIGQAVLTIARLTPGGLLVFLPSYGLMDQLKDRWESTGLLSQLEAGPLDYYDSVENVDCGAGSSVFFEPREAKQMESMLSAYYAAIDEPRGKAVLFAICRGKVSEGINFADSYARSVIVVGIPFP
jgi:Fanconi anemia group J protein